MAIVIGVVLSRYLYRHDPFSSEWRVLAADSAAVHETDFRTTGVIEALQKD